MQFRRDINGLRAIAVMAVVLFHFNEPWMPGGFAGVDVFFVISGFLMTGVIVRGIQQENFSILNFYVARANRIIPALAVLCLVLLVFGWFYLTPLDYRSLGKHVGSSMSFLSNVVYWAESGYFSATSNEKWLLHTWSLSTEWQFYIIYPLLLVSMSKFMPEKAMRVTILLGAVLGYFFCIVATNKWPNLAFYLLPTRAWEMLVGGVAYFYPFTLYERRKKILEWVGLVTIAGSYLLLSRENLWPGWLAMLPVLGSFLVIQAQRNDSPITGNALFQKIGSWSYSIYLWHWPIVVGVYYFSLNEFFIYFGILLSVVAGFISNRYVEKIKFRRDFGSLFSYLLCTPAYMVLIAGLLGSFVFSSQGVHTRFQLTTEVKAIIKELVIPLRSNGYCFYSLKGGRAFVNMEVGSNCYLGSKDENPPTLLFGDSFAGHSEPFFDEIFAAENASFQSVTTNWCTPSLTRRFAGPQSHLAYKQCMLNRVFLKENMHRYKNIIFAASWGSVLAKQQLDDVEAVIAKSAEMGINVFIMAAPYKYLKSPLRAFSRHVYFDLPLDIGSMDGDDALTAEANAILRGFSNRYDKVHFINRTLLYAKQNTFHVNEVIVPYSLEGLHISILGSKYSANHFMRQDEYPILMGYFDLH